MIRIFESKKQRKEREIQKEADSIIMKMGAKALLNETFIAGACVPAVDTFGEDNQLWKTAEEMSELTRAISRERCGQTIDQDNIAEEIADVEIMLFQLKYIFGCYDAVDKWRDKKLVALRMRVAKYKGKQWAQNAVESLQVSKKDAG